MSTISLKDYVAGLPVGTADSTSRHYAVTAGVSVSHSADEIFDTGSAPSIVNVRSEADFGTAMGSTIDLTDGILYILQTLIVTDKTLVIPSGAFVEMSGPATGSGIVYTGSNFLFDSDGAANLFFFRILLFGTPAGRLFNFRNTGSIASSIGFIQGFKDMGVIDNVSSFGMNTFLYSNFTSTAQFIDCGSVTLAGMEIGSPTDTALPLLEVSGTNNVDLSLDNIVGSVPAVNTMSVVDIKPAIGGDARCFIQNIRVRDINLYQSGTIGTITGFADAGGGEVTVTSSAAHGLNDGDQIQIKGDNDYFGGYVISSASGSVFNITAAFNTATANASTWDTGSIDQTNPRVSSTDNFNQPDSMTVAECALSADETVTINTVNVAEIVGGTWVLGPANERFRSSTDGTLTYLGKAPISRTIVFEGTISKSGGGSDALELSIAINGTEVSFSRSPVTDNSNPTFTKSTLTTTINPGDTINGMAVNTDTASDVIVSANSKMLVN